MNDQIFQPGDKVMRVGGAHPTAPKHSGFTGATPKFGQVYCVEDYSMGHQFAVVMLVGFGGWRYDARGRKVGWYANAFRKVEEIRLCVEAVQRKPESVPTTPTPAPAAERKDP